VFAAELLNNDAKGVWGEDYSEGFSSAFHPTGKL
jgi:hypothetical protein